MQLVSLEHKYFKPPFLDKVLLFIKLLGAAHISLTNTSFKCRPVKHWLSLLYNIIMLCLSILIFILSGITFLDQIVNNGDKKHKDIIFYLNMLYVQCFFAWYVLMLFALFTLCWKLKLGPIAKPKYWVTLPEEFEKHSPKSQVIFYSLWIFLCMVLFAMGLIALWYDVLKPSGITKLYNCTITIPDNDSVKLSNVTSKAETEVMLTLVHCYFPLVFVLNIPGIFGCCFVPLYLMVWIDYCARLFKGINYGIRKMKSNDILMLKQLKSQYSVLCDLVNTFNDYYGYLIFLHLTITSFLIFSLTYMITKSTISGISIEIIYFGDLALMATMAILLFCASSKLINEVGIQLILSF